MTAQARTAALLASLAMLTGGCAKAAAEPRPDAYLVITPTPTPTSTTLAEPGYTPSPAGPPAGADR